MSHPSGPPSWKVEQADASPVSFTQTWRASAGDGRRLWTFRSVHDGHQTPVSRCASDAQDSVDVYSLSASSEKTFKNVLVAI